MSAFDDYRKKMKQKYGTSEDKKETSAKDEKSSGAVAKTSAQKPALRSSSFDAYREEMRKKYDPGTFVNEDYINSFLTDAKAFAIGLPSAYNNMGFGSGATDAYAVTNKTAQDLAKRRTAIERYLKKNGSQYDPESLKSFQSYLEQLGKETGSSMYSFYEASKFYSQFESEDIYNAWRNKEDFISEYISDPEKAMATMEYEHDWIREADRRAERDRVLGAVDFQDYSKYTSTAQDGFFKPEYADAAYEIINRNNDAWNQVALGQAWGKYSDKERANLRSYEHMTDEEVGIYNYFYATEGQKRAQEYLDSIQEVLNARVAGDTFAAMEGKTARELLYGVAAGFDQANSGLVNLFNTKDAYIAPSSVQMASGMVREDMKDVGPNLPDWMGGASLGQAAYDFTTTTANMAPSILTSVAVGMLNPAAGAAVGNALMGASAAGNAYQEKLNLGYTQEQARTYGLMVGTSEVVLGKLLGGISKLGGGTLSKIAIKNLDKVDNVLARFAKSMGGRILMNAGSEALEEGLQTVLEPYLWQAVSGEEANVEWEEALYSALMGFATGGLFEGADMAISTSTQNKQAKQIYGTDPDALVGEALEIDPDNAFAQRMQGRLDDGKKLSGGQLNKLVQQNEAAMTAQDMSAIQAAAAQRLTELGETGDVNTIAAALAKQAAGEKLSRAEQQAISESKYGQRVANELNTQNIDSGDYATAWVENIGTNRINAETYGRLVEAAQSQQEAAETTGAKVVPQMQNVAQGQQVEPVAATVRKNRAVAENATAEKSSAVGDKTEATGKNGLLVAEDGVTRQVSTGKEVNPQKIVSVEGGKVMVQTDSGTMAADDIVFGSGDTDLLWRSAAQFNGITTSGANGIIRAYQSGQPVATYLSGAAQEFRNGYYNMESGGEYADKLTEAQREIIYELGQKAAGENTAKAQAKASAGKKATVSKKEKVGKVHFDRKGRTFDGVRETALKTMEQLSKALGVEFYVYESYVNEAGKRVYKDENGNEVHAPNGKYINGKIYIDLNAGADGKGTMLFTIAHELTHFIRQWSPAKFKVLANVLLKQYSEAGVSVEQLVQRQMAKAKRNGRTIDYDTAFEEVVADSMEAMLTDGNVVQMMADLKQQDKSLWQKICEWFKDLVADLQALVEAYKGQKPDSPEGKMVADMQDVIVILESFYADALADAGENYRAASGAQKNTTREGGEKQSIRDDFYSEVDSWDGKSDKTFTVGRTSDVLKSLGAKDSEVIWHSKKMARIMREHPGMTRDVIKQVPQILENPVIILASKQSDSRLVIFGTVTDSNGVPVTAILELQPTNKGGQILDMQIIASAYGKDNTKGLVESSGLVYLDPDKQRTKSWMQGLGLQLPSDTTALGSIGSIAYPDGKVKIESIPYSQYMQGISPKFSLRDTDGNELSREQQEYFKDSKVRDDQGRLMVMYHGTPNGGFTKFHSGTYFTENPGYADVYQNPNASMLSTKKNADAPMTYKVYLNVKKPFDTRNAKERRIFMQEFYRKYGTGTPLAESGLPDWVDGMDLQDFIEEMEYDYDGLILDEGGVGGYGDEVVSRGLSYVVFDPAQVKNVDNNAPTEDPDIRYSVREDSTYAEIEEERQKLRQREIALEGRKREAVNNPELLQAMDDYSSLFTEMRGLFSQKRQGTATQAELDRIAEIKELREKGMKRITELQERLGLNEIAQEETEIRETKEALRIASDAAWAREGAEKENKAIEKAGIPAADYFRKKALKAFKTTTNFNEAGYLLPDGKLLNFSGGERNHRYRDHREIGEIYEATNGVDALNRFLNDGNIRIMAESPGIDLASGVDPTKEQYAAIRRFINANGMKAGQFFVDFSGTDGRRAGNYSYQGRVNADRVINDIKHYYATGEIREQSSISQFLYSDRDSDGGELSEEQRAFFAQSKVRDANGNLLVMYHGSASNSKFTVFERRPTVNGKNYGDGYYFTEEKNEAKKWGSGNLYKVYVNLMNPYYVADQGEVPEAIAAAARENYGKSYDRLSKDPGWWGSKLTREEYIEKNSRMWRNPDIALISAVDGSGIPDGSEASYQGEIARRKTELLRSLGYDGVIVAASKSGRNFREVMAFDSGQIKLTTNRKPTNDPDIRYSERDPELEKVNRVLAKENAELKYDIAYLKELLKLQKQATGGTKFTRTSVEAAAGQLMKYAGAKGEKTELAGHLNGVYEYIAKGEELTWDGIKEAAQPAVEWLQGHVRAGKKLDGYAQDILRQIRGSRIYLDETQKKEVAYQFGSYADYRKSMMGSVIITDKDSISLDSQWHEWAGMYPNIFDPETTVNDMPGALLDAIDSLRNMTDGDSYGYDGELFAQDLLRQVYDSYWNVSTLYTVADKMQKEINRLKYDHIKRMAALRKFHREKTIQLKQDHREAVQRIRQEYRERMDRQRQEITERYQESRKKGVENRHKTEMRRKIRKTIMDLNKLLNRGDKKRNVKEDMQDMVAKALTAADILFTDNYTGEDMVRDGVGTELTEQEAKYMAEAREIMERMGSDGADGSLQGKLDYRLGKLKDVFTRERTRLNKTKVSEVLGDLADAYASLENSEYSYVSGAFDENVHQYLSMLKAEVGGTTVKDMSLSQLEELHKAYTMVLTTVRNANKMFAANLKQTREQLGSQTIAEIQKAGGEHGLWLPGEDKVNAFSWNNEKPVYAFQRIGSDTLTKLFENTRAGEDTWAQDMTSARAYYLAQAKKHRYDSWNFGKQYKFTSTSGIDFTLNLEQIMSLYAYSKRKQAHDHLMKGGFVFDSNTEVQANRMGIKVTYLNKTAKAHNVSMEILADIVSKLEPEQKAFVDEMQDYLSTTMGEKGNEVSMQLYGVKLFNEKHYFPLRSAGQYMARAKEADLKKEQGQISIVNSGFAKATTPKSSNPVVLSGFMDVWASHVNEMSMYHSFVLPMEDFRRVYNYTSPNMETGQSISVNSVIQNAYGKEATDYIDQLYRDLNGGAVSDPRDTPIKALMGKFKKAAVFASLSVVIQQPSAIGRAFAIIDPKYFIGSRVDGKRHKALWAQLKKYAPVAVIKEMGYFDTGMGKSAQDFIKGKEYGTIREKAAALFTDENYRDELLGKGPALADELTWCAIWEAVKRETRAKHKGLSVTSEEFLQLAGKRFTEVVTRTQVYDSVLARSANMRSKGLMTMWTAFMAEPTTTINMVEDALRKGRKGDKGYAARTMGAVLGSVILNSLLVSLVRAMRDDDEDETWLEKYAQSFATEILDGINPLTYYPFLKDIWSALQGFDIERSDMSLITSLTEALTKLVQVYSKDTDGMDEDQLAAYHKSLSGAWWNVADYVTALAGIPVKNVRRDINGAINMVETIGADLTDRDTSWGSLLDRTWDEMKNSIPVVGWFPDKTAADKLYKATVSGDTAYQKRLASSYATESALNSAIRKGLRNNDSRIWEAAMAWNNNDLESYKRIAREIISEGHFSQDNVVMAIRAEADAMAPDEAETSTSKAKGLFTAEKFAVAVSQGNDTMAAAIKADIMETAQRNGKTAEEAESSFASSAKSEMKELFLTDGINANRVIDALTTYCDYSEEKATETVTKWRAEKETGIVYDDIDDAFKDGEISAAEARDMYITYGGYSAEDAAEKVDKLAFEREYPELSERITYTQYKRWEADGKPNGVDVEVFTDVAEFRDDGTSDSVKSQEEVAAYINSLPISTAQKDALWCCFWKESTLKKAPWH